MKMPDQFPVYLVYGSERYLIEENREQILKSVVTHSETDVDFAIYDLHEVPVEQAIEDAETIPFLASKRVVILKNPSFLTAERKTSVLVEHDLTKLEEYLNNPAPFSIVIIEAPYEKLDERKKIVKVLKKKAKVVQASPPHHNKINDWIRQQCAELNVAIDGVACERLTQLAGKDLRKLKSELEKLALFVNGEKITVEIVERLVSRSLEDNVFVLVDHVVHKRVEKAFQSLRDLFEYKEEPIKILALLARQFRIIAQVSELSQKGYSQKQMASLLKQHPYAIQQALRQSRLVTKEECFSMIEQLAEVDYFMKIGKFDQKLLLELLLTKTA